MCILEINLILLHKGNTYYLLYITLQVFGSGCMFLWKSICTDQNFSKIMIRCSLELSSASIPQPCTCLTGYMWLISLKQLRITLISRSLEHTWLYNGFVDLNSLMVSLKKNSWAAWILLKSRFTEFLFGCLWLLKGNLPEGNAALKDLSCFNVNAASLENYHGLGFELKSSCFPPGFNGNKINISLYTLNLKMLIDMCEVPILKP